MEIELHIEKLEPERRWNRLESFENDAGVVLGRFLSFRDDDTFVWMRGFATREERLATHAKRLAAPARNGAAVHALTPALGSTITELDQFARIAESPVLEIRLYRIVPGARARFATFFRDRVIPSHEKYGMPLYGQFDALDDENLFVFLRGFPDLVERDRVKAAYYQSRMWLEEMQDEAFSMIADYSNVLLVTPVKIT